jgi:hypothetical protein
MLQNTSRAWCYRLMAAILLGFKFLLRGISVSIIAITLTEMPIIVTEISATPAD